MTDESEVFHLVGGDDKLIAAIRHTPVNRDAFVHEFQCPACAHRDHQRCALNCSYCEVSCGCVCRRWAVSPPS